ncbi:DNA helicase UvrD [Bacillus anthracis]|nr:DNA helicase UvrD [Bacillus anthracis]PEZ79988.1 DNA helicase UvrD [Bacillus anthracis]
MNKFLSPTEWSPVENMFFDETTLELIKSNQNMLISAGPGAGKTELLAQKAAYLLQTNTCGNPQKILALSYKVDAAKNLEQRVEDRIGKELSKRFVSKTYDSFAKSILDQFKNLLPPFYQVESDYEIASNGDIINAYKSVKLPNDFQLNRFNINTYLTEFRLPLATTPYGDVARDVWPILLRGNEHLSPKLNFKMIARLAEFIIRNNILLQKSLQLTYSHVFLDEFQDTPAHHYDLIETSFKHQQVMTTAVGDKKQQIMLWAGALRNVFDRFKADFSAEEKILFVNHRSAPKLIELQKPMIRELIGEEIEIKHNERWDSEQGESELWYFRNEFEEAVFVCSKIKELLKQKSTELSDICILVRQRPDIYTKEILDHFNKNGIDVRIEDKYQTLLKEELINLFVSIIMLSQKKQAADEWIFITDTIKKIHGFSTSTSVNKIYDLEMKTDHFIKQLNSWLKDTKGFKDFKEVLDKICDFLNVDLINSVYSQYTKGYIESLLKDFATLLWNEYMNCHEWILSLERFMGKHSIPIMSIHKSKGLEFKMVILVGVEDGAFWDIQRSPEAELCTFFVGSSRAIEKMYYTFTDKRNGRRNSNEKVETFYNLLSDSKVVREYDFSNGTHKVDEYFTTPPIL